MKFIIHSCDDRLWYVRGFLIPAMKAQGLDPVIHNDDDHRGCLWAYIDSFRGLSGDGSWHLQDDVMICRDFSEITKSCDDGIVYGFFHKHRPEDVFIPGKVSVMKATYSFPCMRIPDKLAVEFADWFLSEAQFRDEYQRWIEERKYVDVFWRDFLRERHPDEFVYNLKPSIVDHIDEYIGGSTINYWRDGWCHADYFDDTETIEDLKIKLANLK